MAKRFPTTEYASDARLKLDMVQDQLAGKEMNVGRFYLRSGNPVAAIGRFRTVVDKYQTTTHTPEALYRLVESYLTVGLVHEAKENAAVLGYNYPGDPWYSDAYKLMTTRGFRPSQAPQPGGRRGLHLPFFGRHKETTLPPPAAEPPTEATDETETQSEPKSQAPAKQGGLVHGVLGL